MAFDHVDTREQHFKRDVTCHLRRVREITDHTVEVAALGDFQRDAGYRIKTARGLARPGLSPALQRGPQRRPSIAALEGAACRFYGRKFLNSER